MYECVDSIPFRGNEAFNIIFALLQFCSFLLWCVSLIAEKKYNFYQIFFNFKNRLKFTLSKQNKFQHVVKTPFKCLQYLPIISFPSPRSTQRELFLNLALHEYLKDFALSNMYQHFAPSLPIYRSVLENMLIHIFYFVALFFFSESYRQENLVVM